MVPQTDQSSYDTSDNDEFDIPGVVFQEDYDIEEASWLA